MLLQQQPSFCSALTRRSFSGCGTITPSRQQKLAVCAAHGHSHIDTAHMSRRATSLAAAGALLLATSRRAGAEEQDNSTVTQEDLVITDVVYLDIGLCPEGLRQDRRTGDKSALCEQPSPLGRVIVGLFGRQAPSTTATFLALVKAGAYNRTTFSKVLPGRWIQAGRQGSPRMGGVALPPDLPPNDDLLAARSFRLRHSSPGTVSLAVAENDDDARLKTGRNYHNVEFLVTTGPGPVPALDGENIVMGCVLEGLGTVAQVANVPTFQPSDRTQALNQIASLIGDSRAAKVRAKYGQPLRAVVIQDSGVLPIREPFAWHA